MSDPLTRRTFLQTTGVAAAAALAGTTALQAVDKPLKLRKAVKLSMVGGNAPLVEKCKMLKEVGFEGIDMDRPADHAEVRKAMDESGLIVHGVVDYVHWKQPLSDADPAVRAEGLEGLKTALRDCKAYGGDTVLLVPAVVNKKVSYAEAYERSQAEIKKALPLAQELNIKILFENVWNNFLLSPLETARYIDEFQTPLVGSYFDVGNMIRYGWPEHWIQTLGPRIGKLDIKEYSRKIANDEGVGKGFRAEIGDGEDGCDWPAVMTALKAIGFSGWATAEVRGGEKERMAEISQRMDKIFTGYGT
ncbi:MAG TPA: sugar phosphate isomerase/epimerase family protein [Planctomycetaceae bacterium]|nr:sugar phosphate isomerase/epimerase family protein [Planctomycetaceae bacterium]